MFRELIRFAAFACIPLASVVACSDSVVLAEGPAPVNEFTAADGGGDASAVAPSSEDVRMCPVTECPFPFATCSTSEFLCDVDLMSDDENCGACGVSCGGPNDGNSNWTCVDGKCTFSCHPRFRDCDGNRTNGCETPVTTKENCGACGVQCGEDEECERGVKCVNPCVEYGRPDRCPDPTLPGRTVCKDLRTDDKNCGTCGNVCDPDNGEPPHPHLPQLPPDMYYGCAEWECVAAKCKDRFTANCNLDLADGCEVRLGTNDNCSFCGDKCAPDQLCYNHPFLGPRCVCAPGETFCFNFSCVRLDDDPNNCGACNHKCPGIDRPHFVVECTAGACGGHCEAHFADCDGLAVNGCEIDTRIDNRNCGGCGRACLPGQVCSGGECLVAPCEPEGPSAK